MYAIGTAALILGVCIKTLRRWEYAKKITCVRTPGGHRRFPVQEIARIVKSQSQKGSVSSSTHESPHLCALYGRVSSHKQCQRGDLDRQIQHLRAYALKQGICVYRVYKDIGSGLNVRRKSLWKLVRDARKGLFSSVLLTYKDRLTRFGYEYLHKYLAEFNVSIRYVHELDEKSPESEMVEDLVAIIHSFSGKLYRMRRSKKRKTSNSPGEH